MDEHERPRALPEIVLLIGACGLLVIDLFVPDATAQRDLRAGARDRGARPARALWPCCQPGSSRTAFNGMFVTDPMANVLKLFAIASVAVMLIYSRSYCADRGLLTGEFFTLTLFALLGMLVMISAQQLPDDLPRPGTDVAVAVRAGRAAPRLHARSTEAAMKYFVLGALASGFLLYGMSMMYGATGTLDITEVADGIGSGHVASRIVLRVRHWSSSSPA